MGRYNNIFGDIMGYSWENLIALTDEPDKFVKLLNSNKMTDIELSEAAEIGGFALSPKIIFDTLFKLLDHKSALVREGALYGLEDSEHITEPLLIKLKDMMLNDPSEGVRQVATNFYEDIRGECQN